ncbi:MAG TPA: hypothetical protein VIJ94_08890 [Caulobacteraceae bacterium]
MIDKAWRWARKGWQPKPPAAEAPQGRDRLIQLVAHERAKVAKLKARLAASESNATDLLTALSTLEADGKTLFDDYRNLRKRLRWHWAEYPGSKRDWRRAPAGSDPFAERALALKARLVDLMAAPEFDTDDRRVTAVVTSCARHGLLKRTLESFFDTSAGAIEKMIVVEDGEQEADQALKDAFAAWPIDWINTGGRVGQIRAIDLAYSLVETPYIFHMEDDWRFLRPGYIPKSIAVLQAEPLCLEVLIKGRPPPGSHGSTEQDRVSGGVPWRPMIKDRKNVWHGFSFNPGLRRLREYRLVGSRYQDVAEAALGRAGLAEAQLSELYASIGYFAANLWEEDGARFARHLGHKLHVTPRSKRRSLGNKV